MTSQDEEVGARRGAAEPGVEVAMWAYETGRIRH